MSEVNVRIGELLQDYADLLAVSGADRFKVRAYDRAARAIREHGVDVTTLDVRQLQTIPNVGRGIAEKVSEYVRTGRIEEVERLRAASAPASVRALMEIPGLGPKGAMRLHAELGIASRQDLEDALRDDRVGQLKGFGPKAVERIRQGLERADETGRRALLTVALTAAQDVLAQLREVPQVQRCAFAGSLRRMRETIGDIDLLAASDEPEAVMDAFCRLPLVEQVLVRGETKCTVISTRGPQMDLRVVAPAVWGAALQYFTGSKEHNVRVRERAVRRGLTLSEYGLHETGTGRVVAAATEQDVYEGLGLAWIPPTLREDRGEVQAAAEGRLPTLVDVSELRGDLQSHSDYSDGKTSLRRMVLAAAARGYDYYAITDHGRRLTFMRNLSLEAIDRQRAEVGQLNAELAGQMVVLHGVELNVGPHGELDYPDEVLAGFDIVVASVHHDLRASRERMTQRLLRAISNPHVNVLGHPTNRRLGSREPSDIDLEQVFEAAAQHQVAVEINSLPERMDLCDEHVLQARRHGVRFAISTDAHTTGELDNIRYGVATAQRGWVQADEVVNTWPLERLRGFLAKQADQVR